MQVRRTPSAFGAETFSEHADDRVKLFALEIAIRISASNHREEIIFGPLFGSDSRDYLLRQNIERAFGNFQVIKFTASHRVDNCGNLDKFVARKRKNPALRKTSD